MCDTIAYKPQHVSHYSKKSGLKWDFSNWLVTGLTHPLLPIETNEGHIFAHWGLIPSYTETKEDARKFAKQCLNAPIESFQVKPVFNSRFMSKRCLIPCSGFIEYTQLGERRFPYFIHNGDKMMNLGGLWDVWEYEGKRIHTFTIVTTAANELLRGIDNTRRRMPVVVAAEFANEWLALEYSDQIGNYALRPWLELYAHTIMEPQMAMRLEDPLKKFSYQELKTL